MDVIEILLIFAIIFWILFLVGTMHVMRAFEIRREKKNASSFKMGVSGSMTSNSKRRFQIRIEKVEKKITKIWLHGTLTGGMPFRNDVIYLETEQFRVPVIICRIIAENMPNEMQGVPVRVKVTGMTQKQMQQLTEMNLQESKALLTNLRNPEKSAEAEKKPQAPSPQTVVNRLTWPVIVTAPLKNRFIPALVAVIGLIDAGSILKGLVWGVVDADEVILILFLGLAFAIIGLAWLFYEFSFRIKITETQVEIRKFLKKSVYHINNLYYTASLPADKSERWVMTISNKAGKQLAQINSNYRNYEALLNVFRLAAEKQREARLREQISEYLLTTGFYIPSLTAEDPESGELIVQPHIRVHRDTGARTVFLFDNEEAAEEDSPKEALTQTLLKNAIPMIREWNLDRLTIWPSREWATEPIEITEEFWNNLQKDEEKEKKE